MQPSGIRLDPARDWSTRPAARIPRSLPVPPRPPFEACSLQSLRLLVGYALFAEEAAAARCALLRLTGREPSTCGTLLRAVAAARSHPSTAWTLDGSLAALLGGHARPFEALSVAALAELWWQRGASLAGPALAALVWWLARDERVVVRPLERRIVAGLDAARLLSPAQLAVASEDRARPESCGREDPCGPHFS